MTEITAITPDIPWPAIVGMRNNLIHGYNEVNYTFVWKVVENDLLDLEGKVRGILKNLSLPKDFSPPAI